MPPSGAAAWVSAYFSQSTKTVGVYLTFSRDFSPSAWPELRSQKAEIEAEMELTLSWEDEGNGKYYIVDRSRYDSLEDSATLDRINRFFLTRLNSFINAFRPRLSRLVERM
jgi:hypothetical protein